MSKFTIILLVATFAAAINADVDGAGGGFLTSIGNPEQWMKSVTSGIDKAMKDTEKLIETKVPGANEQFHGHSSSQSTSTEIKDGKVVKDTADSKDVDNNNGQITVSGTGDQ